MFDRELTIETLGRIKGLLHEILVWTEGINSPDDFTKSPTGMILLNAVCMKLLAVGEEVKSLDRRTRGELLPRYNSVPWKEVMGLRDVIAHHYFEVDAAEILVVIQSDIQPLRETILQMMREADDQAAKK